MRLNEKMGGVVQGANDIGQLCKELEKDHATSTGTIVRAVKSFSEVEQWYGVWRTPEQALVAVESIQHPLDMHVPIPDLLYSKQWPMCWRAGIIKWWPTERPSASVF